MYSTVEKLLTLRTAPMFEKLRSEDLTPLARVAEVDRLEAGDVIFEEGELGSALYVVVRGTVADFPATLPKLFKGENFGKLVLQLAD